MTFAFLSLVVNRLPLDRHRNLTGLIDKKIEITVFLINMPVNILIRDQIQRSFTRDAEYVLSIYSFIQCLLRVEVMQSQLNS